MCHLTRTIWPVGHGAFYTERFEDIDGKGTSFTAVYDCGAYQFGIRYEDILKSEIDKFLGRLRNNVIDVVFLSHFDKDHVNGFRYLLSKNVTIRNLIIPNLSNEQLVCALLKNVVEEEPLDEDIRWFFSLLSNMENRGDMRIVRIPDLRATTEHDEQIEHDILQIPNSILPKARFTLGRCRNGAPMWVYIPVHQSYNQTKSKRLYQQILQAIDDVPANASFSEIFVKILEFCSSPQNHKRLMQIYRGIYGNIGDNDFSMPVYSGFYTNMVDVAHIRISISQLPMFVYHDCVCSTINSRNWNCAARIINCLYMGDFETNKKGRLSHLKKHLGDYWYKVGLVQVPHHASKHNHNIGLYHPGQLCFASVYENNDCSFSVDVPQSLDKISSSFIKVTEKPDSRLELEYYIYR